MMAQLNRPLSGVTVIALEQAVSMPFCSFMLAELGADVIKIERPRRGDVLRGWDDAVGGLSSGYVWLNAGKKGIAVDVSQSRGQAVIKDLVTQADVFVENFAPGVADRLGLGHKDLMLSNPRLVYCSLSGYGQQGPYRDVKAYDLLVQGESGILLTSGYPEAPAKVGPPIVDLIAGANAAIGIVSALRQINTTGTGVYLDVAMLDAAIPWLGYFPHRYWHREGEEPPRTGMRHQYICPYGPYLASDGRYVNLVIASSHHWQLFCEKVVERAEWLNDPVFSTIQSRQEHRDTVERAIEDAIAMRPSYDWFERLSNAGLPYGRVRTIGEALKHPQLVSRKIFVEATSPVGQIPIVRFPLASPDRRRHIPALGEHTDVVLGSLGYSNESISSMRDDGVIE